MRVNSRRRAFHLFAALRLCASLFLPPWVSVFFRLISVLTASFCASLHNSPYGVKVDQAEFLRIQLRSTADDSAVDSLLLFVFASKNDSPNWSCGVVCTRVSVRGYSILDFPFPILETGDPKTRSLTIWFLDFSALIFVLGAWQTKDQAQKTKNEPPHLVVSLACF